MVHTVLVARLGVSSCNGSLQGFDKTQSKVPSVLPSVVRDDIFTSQLAVQEPRLVCIHVNRIDGDIRLCCHRAVLSDAILIFLNSG